MSPIGRRYADTILGMGGVQLRRTPPHIRSAFFVGGLSAGEVFRRFRGREPDVKFMLEQAALLQETVDETHDR